jgi:hypothetical protein
MKHATGFVLGIIVLFPALLYAQPALRVFGSVTVTNGGISVTGTNPLGALRVVGKGTTAAFLNSDNCTALEVQGGGGCYAVSISGTRGLTVAGSSDFYGNFTVWNGSKSAIVPTTQGDRKLYCEESSQVWFADYGSARLTNGAANITIDPLFAETVNLQRPYHVFVQAYDEECEGLAVVNRTPTSFEVRERKHGRSNGEFSYRLVGLRLKFEDKRLEPADPL